MKRIANLLLCLMLVCTLTACSSEEPSETPDVPLVEKPSETPAEIPVETPEETPDEAPAAVPQETPAEPPVEEPAEPQPAFDNSWASNGFEALIPQPPFEGWTGEVVSSTRYKMETSQANADGATNPDGSWVYYDIFHAYAQQLSECGYTVTGESSGTQFNCVDKDDNQVFLMCGDGFCWITINTINPIE